jgi:hypothetical protein
MAKEDHKVPLIMPPEIGIYFLKYPFSWDLKGDKGKR